MKDALLAVGVADVRGEGLHTVRRAMARCLFDSLTVDRGYENALRVVSAWLHHQSITTTENYIGLSSETRTRDLALRGQPFLTAMLSTPDNVVPLYRATT